MQRLHDKVNGNWQKITAMVYEMNKSRDLKKENRKSHLKKKFLNLWLWQKREYPDIYAHHIFYKNFRQFCPLFEPDFYTKLDEKLVKCQTICWKVIAREIQYDINCQYV